jgi:hypothetical protein
MTPLHSFFSLVCGLLIMPLILFPVAWGDLALLAVIVALLYIFWSPLCRLNESVRTDYEIWRLERDLERGVHVDADAEIAFRLLRGE